MTNTVLDPLTLFAQHEYKKAANLWSKRIKKISTGNLSSPERLRLLSHRCAAYLALKEYALALTDAESVLRVRATPLCYRYSGLALHAMDQPGPALSSYKKGLALLDEQEQSQELDRPAFILRTQLCKGISEIELEQAACQHTTDKQDKEEEERFERLLQWLRQGGAKFPKLTLRQYSPEFRGVVAASKVRPADTILYVPLKYIMTQEMAQESKIGRQLKAAMVDKADKLILNSSHSWLAAYLLQEQATPSSFWQPYLQILPQDYHSVPINFTEEEKSWLTGSMALQKEAERRQSLLEEYTNICKHVFEFKRFTLKQFTWARLAVITRIFGIKVGEHKTCGLVPYADMLNHKRPQQTRWEYSNAKRGFVIVALECIQPGQQVFDSYGPKCNSRFFVNYGFALDHNTQNTAYISLTLPLHVWARAEKLAMLGQQETRRFQVHPSLAGQGTGNLFSTLRFMVLGGDEWTHFKRYFSGGPRSVENERQALELLQGAVQHALQAFPTSLAEDNALLQSETLPMFGNHRNCVVMRHGEKQVLHAFLQLSQKGLELLQIRRFRFRAAVRQLLEESAPSTLLVEYVQEVLIPLRGLC